jgi:hypothetical protein
MAKIPRMTQKIFGSAAGPNQISTFGSLAAGLPAFTTDPEVIQSLGNYLTGWFGGVVGANSPAMEDMNALCYLYAYQLAYVMQSGVPEWDAETTYFIGSFASNGTGQIYRSLTDNNLNNAFTSVANWRVANAGPYTRVVGGVDFPLLTSTPFVSGDSILVIADIVETTNVSIAVPDVRIDCMPGKRITSTVSGLTSPFTVNLAGVRFRSNNLNLRMNGALNASISALSLGSDDSIISALFIDLNNAALATTDVIKITGNRTDITSGSVVATLGTYTNLYADTGLNNDARLRG